MARTGGLARFPPAATLHGHWWRDRHLSHGPCVTFLASVTPWPGTAGLGAIRAKMPVIIAVILGPPCCPPTQLLPGGPASSPGVQQPCWVSPTSRGVPPTVILPSESLPTAEACPPSTTRLSFLTPASSSICLSGPSCPWLGGIDSCLHNSWPVSEAVGTDVMCFLLGPRASGSGPADTASFRESEQHMALFSPLPGPHPSFGASGGAPSCQVLPFWGTPSVRRDLLCPMWPSALSDIPLLISSFAMGSSFSGVSSWPRGDGGAHLCPSHSTAWSRPSAE